MSERTIPAWDPDKGPDPLLIDLRYLRGGRYPYRGSDYPVQQMADALEAIGVIYMMVVGIDGSRSTGVTSNVRGEGLAALEAIRHAANFHLDETRQKIQEEGEDPPTS